MTKRTTVAVLFASLIGMTAQAQPPARSRYRNSVNADLGLSVIGVAYRRILHSRVELELQAQFYSPWFLTSGIAGIGAQLRSFFYIAGSAPAGAFVSPFVRATVVRGRLNEVEGTGLGWTVGATVGQSFVFARRGVIRGGVGLQYISYGVASETAKARVQTIYPTIDLSIGVAF